MLLGGSLDGREVEAKVVLRDEALVLAQPGLPHAGLAVEPGGQLLELLLPDQLLPEGQLSLMLGLLQPLPGLVDVRDGLALLGEVGRLVVGPHLGLQREQEDLKVALLHELGRLLDVPVRVELGQLFLNATEAVGELAIAEVLDDALDPLEEVGGEGLIVIDHLVALHGNADHLGDPLALHGLLLQLGKVVVVGHDVGDDGLLVG